MVERPLWTLSIPDSVTRKLKDAGFEYLSDILCERNKEVVRKLAPELESNQLTYLSESKTALELYLDHNEQNGNIVTFSRAIDRMIGGGIPTGKITELVGGPGCGKTQICLQLCISVQIPQALGCLSGAAVYIETKGNFSTKRIREIYEASVKHCLKISQKMNLSQNENSALEKFIRTNPLFNITRFSVLTPEEIRASIFQLRKLTAENKNIKLIIIDCFTFPFYSQESDFKRTSLISELMNELNQIAGVYNVAVVVTNSLTTRIYANGTTEIIPSLGETFAHFVHNRILLGQMKSEFYSALMQKSSQSPCTSAAFQITTDGIRDVVCDPQ